MVRLLGGQGHRERPRIGQPDVLRGHPHHPARDVERVLAPHEHPGQPVQGAFHVGAADRLVERGDDVVVLFAALVVFGETTREDGLEDVS